MIGREQRRVHIVDGRLMKPWLERRSIERARGRRRRVTGTQLRADEVQSMKTHTTTTVFSSTPMPEIVMRTTSPACNVKLSSGTTPVPVSSTAPSANT